MLVVFLENKVQLAAAVSHRSPECGPGSSSSSQRFLL